jgi:hypothetical protein
MNRTPTPPSEFDLPLAGTAVWAGPDGLGESRFDDVPATRERDQVHVTQRPLRAVDAVRTVALA